MANKILPFSQIPGPKGLPLVGSLFNYIIGPYSKEKYHESLLDLYKKYGSVVKQKIGPKQFVHVFDPVEVEKVYAIEGKMPEVVPLQATIKRYREIKDLSPGLGNINGKEWYRLRKAIQRAILLPQNVRKYLPLVDAGAAALVREIQKRRDGNQEIQNLPMLISKWNLEMAGQIFLGISLGCMDGGKNEERAERAIFRNLEVFSLTADLDFALSASHSTSKWKSLIEAEDAVMDYITNHAKEAIDKAIKLKGEGKLDKEKFAFLAHLLNQPDLDRRDIFILVLSMLTDGLGTTSPALVSNLYCLSTNPKAQATFYDEIKREIPPSDEFIGETFDRLPYLNACLKESFRLFPTGPVVSRIIPKDVVIKNYLIPAGTPLDLNYFVLSKSEKFFPDPNTHKPERWLKADMKSTIHPYFRSPFSVGIRTCAGRRFAQQDLSLLLCRLIQNFQLQYNDTEPMKQVYKILLFPDRSPKIAFHDRK